MWTDKKKFYVLIFGIRLQNSLLIESTEYESNEGNIKKQNIKYDFFLYENKFNVILAHVQNKDAASSFGFLCFTSSY